jgi:hypothetical protein
LCDKKKSRLGITPLDEIRRFDKNVAKDLLQIVTKHVGREGIHDAIDSLKGNTANVVDWEGEGDDDASLESVKSRDKKKGMKSVEVLGFQDTVFVGNCRCTVFGCSPRMLVEGNNALGLVVQIPDTIGELLRLASQHFGCTYDRVVNEDMGEILDTKLIRDSEKVFVVSD